MGIIYRWGLCYMIICFRVWRIFGVFDIGFDFNIYILLDCVFNIRR